MKPSLDAQGVQLGGYLLLVIPVVIAASALSYYAVERPWLAGKRAKK